MRFVRFSNGRAAGERTHSADSCAADRGRSLRASAAAERIAEGNATGVALAEEAGITNGPPPRLIKGRDVLPYFHGNAGPHIGRAVAATHEAFLKGRIDTVDDARIWLKKYVESEARLVRGSDVLAHMAKPGPGVRKVLQAAWDAQLAGAFCDDKGAKEWLEKYFEAGHADTI